MAFGDNHAEVPMGLLDDMSRDECSLQTDRSVGSGLGHPERMYNTESNRNQGWEGQPYVLGSG